MSLYTGTPTGDLLLRLLFSGTCGVFLYLISGEKAVRDYSGSTAYVIKTLSVYWIILGLLGCLSVLPAFFIDDTEFYSDWYFRLITNIFFYLSVGLFEELLFRAIINDALIYQFRNVKHIFLISGILTSFVFGFAHVFQVFLVGDVDSGIEAAQAVMKIISTAVFGLNPLVMYWKTRNIWACAVVHGGFDFFSSISTSIIVSENPESYVNASGGMGLVIAYAIQTLIEFIVFIVVWNKIGKKIDFEKLREEW